MIFRYPLAVRFLAALDPEQSQRAGLASPTTSFKYLLDTDVQRVFPTLSRCGFTCDRAVHSRIYPPTHSEKLNMTVKTRAFFVLVLLLVAAAPMSHAGDVEAGKAKSIICSGCHGPDGMGADPTETQPVFPMIAGQREAYAIQAITEYKTGKRKDALMTPVSKGLSEEDIANLAAYYATLR